MKKILLIGLLLCLTLSIFANVKQQDNSEPTAVLSNRTGSELSRDMTEPVISWGVTPMTVKSSDYYDYQNGAYNGTALQLQPSGLGLYMSYMFRGVALASGLRTVNFAYIDPNSAQPQYESTITNKTSNEGFVTMALDPVTQNPFFTWHAKYSAEDNGGTADALFNCYLTVDNFNAMSAPGSLFGLIKVIENTSDEFTYEWPVVFVGASPNANMRRVYVFANNGGQKPTTSTPSSNVKLAWADFNNASFEGAELSFTWNYRTFDYLDAIHNTPLSARAFPTFAVKNNYVIIGGNVSADGGISAADDSTNIIYPAHNLFYLVNENYGEGDFTLHTFTSKRAVPNPTDSLGVDDGSGYASFEVQDSYAYHKNMVFDNYNRVHFIGNYATTFLESASASEDQRKYWAWTQTVKDVIFDLNSDTLMVTDLDPKSDNPYDNLLFPGWDLTDDNVPDSYDEEGGWEYAFYNVPMPYYDAADFFYYNYFRETNANSKGWMAALWSNTTNSYRNLTLQDPDFAAWAQTPELVIIFSRDNGRTWSKAKYLNSQNTTQLANMIPSFSYLAPEIEVLNETTGRIHLMLTNDNSYGSAVQNDGSNTGCSIMYAAIDVDFTQFTGNDEPVAVVKPAMLKQNYPNPFNPKTTICFNLSSPEKVNLSVYNVKGQLVKTLVNEYFTAGSHEINWNGVDNNNKSVASGVYFYRLSTPNNKEMKKMLLIK